MSFEHEKREARRMLASIEDGAPSIAEVRPTFEAADPALVYAMFAWLRAHYGAGHSAAEGVLGRIVGLCGSSTAVAQMARTGGRDAIVAWFEETYDYRDVDRDTFIDVMVEKLEG